MPESAGTYSNCQGNEESYRRSYDLDAERALAALNAHNWREVHDFGGLGSAKGKDIRARSICQVNGETASERSSVVREDTR